MHISTHGAKSRGRARARPLAARLVPQQLDVLGVVVKVGAQTSSVGEQSSAARPILLSYCTHLRNSMKMMLSSSML